MGFSRQEYWSGLPFPSPGDLPDPGIESGSPALQADPKIFVDFVSRKLMILIYMEVQKTKVEKAGLKEIVPVIKTYHH